MEKTIFKKIVDQEIPVKLVFQDDRVTAFADLSPRAPVHILIVPNYTIPTVNDVTEQDEATLGHLFVVAKKIAKEYNIDKSGYRLVVNCNEDAGQSVFHLHMHLIGGANLGSMCS